MDKCSASKWIIQAVKLISKMKASNLGNTSAKISFFDILNVIQCDRCLDQSLKLFQLQVCHNFFLQIPQLRKHVQRKLSFSPMMYIQHVYLTLSLPLKNQQCRPAVRISLVWSSLIWAAAALHIWTCSRYKAWFSCSAQDWPTNWTTGSSHQVIGQ